MPAAKKFQINLTSEQISEIATIVGQAITSADQLVQLIKAAHTVRVAGVDVTLPDEDVAAILEQHEASGTGSLEDATRQTILCALEFFLHGCVTRDLPA